jgi:hypothetical protein
MRRVVEERRLGSLFGDIEQMSDGIKSALMACDVTVWLDSKAELICSGTGIAPALPPEYLLGTYGIGADRSDIREDLVEFRNERVSHAMIF